MDETQQVLGLVGDIYDAALDPSAWHDTLGKAAKFVGGATAALWCKDAVSGKDKASHIFGFDPGYVQAYLDEYYALDPAAMHHFFARIGEPLAQASLVPENEFVESRFYREWARPQGFVDCLQVTLDKSATHLALFGVSCDEHYGAADERMRRRMKIIAPHLRRAMFIGVTIDHTTVQEVKTLADTLDGLGAGIFLISASGHLVHTNAAGNAILIAGDVLLLIGGRLVARNQRTDWILRNIFAHAVDGDASVGTQGIAMQLAAHDGTQYVAHVLPLTSGARRRPRSNEKAVAAVFIRRAALEIRSSSELIAKTFQLTAMELRVMLAIVEVGGAPEVADALGIGSGTVKSHLKRLFQKTGCSRQADLVKLIARFSSPLRELEVQDIQRPS